MNLPAHLSSNQATGLALQEPVAQFEIGTTQNFVYLILDWSTHQAAIVDPQKDLSAPLEALEQNGFKLTTILLTHTHYDHVAGVGPLLQKFPQLIIRLGEADLHRMPKVVTLAPGLKILSEGEMLRVGDLQIRALHTPGHSAGEFCYFLDPKLNASLHHPYLFTGDTIFIRDCGRTDFEDGSNEAMFASIQKIKTLPPETIFLVGHHYAKECSTTLGDELQKSPPLRVKSVEELAALP